jgi:hypothetical protein
MQRLESVLNLPPKLRAMWEQQKAKEDLWQIWGTDLAQVELLDTAPWPDKPEEGHLHPITVCRQGSHIRMDTHAFIYHEGKWLWAGHLGGPHVVGLEVMERFLRQ